MKPKAAGFRKAIAHLRRVDPVMDEVISKVGPFNLTLRTAGTHFDALIRSIVYQQLSGKAAATIHGRVLLLFNLSLECFVFIHETRHNFLQVQNVVVKRADSVLEVKVFGKLRSLTYSVQSLSCLAEKLKR